jgi:hypothetical protein
MSAVARIQPEATRTSAGHWVLSRAPSNDSTLRIRAPRSRTVPLAVNPALNSAALACRPYSARDPAPGTMAYLAKSTSSSGTFSILADTESSRWMLSRGDGAVGEITP